MMHSLIKQTLNRARPIALGLFHHRLPRNSSLSFKSSEDAKFEKIKYVFLNIADFYLTESENPQARSNALNLKKSIESIHNETDLASLVTQSYPLKPWKDVRDTIVYLDFFLDRSRVVEQLFKILQKPRQAGLPLVFPEELITDYMQVLRSSYEQIIEQNDLQSGWPQELNRIYGTTYPTDEQIQQYIIKDLYNRLEIFGGYKEKLDSMAEYVHQHHQKIIKPLPDDTPSLKF